MWVGWRQENLWRALIVNCWFGRKRRLWQSRFIRKHKAYLRPNSTAYHRKSDVQRFQSRRILLRVQGRLTPGEFQQFLGHARGSLLELDTQLAIAHDLGYLSDAVHSDLEHEAYQVLGLLNRLLESIKAKRSLP